MSYKTAMVIENANPSPEWARKCRTNFHVTQYGYREQGEHRVGDVSVMVAGGK
ncbi:MAG: hypothetical protein IID61_06110 [SAR324 cluster bacterium]|nr:hypothetical protein [SAR324 cluster bacterium]